MTSGAGPADGRRPWWYSGDEDAPAERVDTEPEPAATGDESPSPDSAGPAAGVDWSLLMAGAQRMVDWATDKVMAPHADHDDPTEHPQCMVCRTLVLVGDSSARAPRGAEASDTGAPGETAPDPDAPEPIRWIPIRD